MARHTSWLAGIALVVVAASGAISEDISLIQFCPREADRVLGDCVCLESSGNVSSRGEACFAHGTARTTLEGSGTVSTVYPACDSGEILVPRVTQMPVCIAIGAWHEPKWEPKP